MSKADWHRVSHSWQMAVRCGLDEMIPNPKYCCFDSLHSFFPRVRPQRLPEFADVFCDNRGAFVAALQRPQRHICKFTDARMSQAPAWHMCDLMLGFTKCQGQDIMDTAD